MANRYGEAALMATQQMPSGDISPVARWESAMEKLYPTSTAARKKSCPRGAFLGLCEEGLVKNIPAGRYAASKIDKAYAVRAVALLTEGTQHRSTSALWRAVTNGAEKRHSSQMDIVLALWNNDLIVGKL
jgi:uncharacterized protein DUF6979